MRLLNLEIGENTHGVRRKLGHGIGSGGLVRLPSPAIIDQDDLMLTAQLFNLLRQPVADGAAHPGQH